MAVSAALLAPALLFRLLLAADEAHVYWLGSALTGECSLRSRFGVPCLTCGMTRSVALSLHGEWARAWAIAPGGPAWVAAYLAVACVLAGLGAWQWRTGRALPPRARRVLIRVIFALCLAAMVIWIGGWVSTLLSRKLP